MLNNNACRFYAHTLAAKSPAKINDAIVHGIQLEGTTNVHLLSFSHTFKRCHAETCSGFLVLSAGRKLAKYPRQTFENWICALKISEWMWSNRQRHPLMKNRAIVIAQGAVKELIDTEKRTLTNWGNTHRVSLCVQAKFSWQRGAIRIIEMVENQHAKQTNKKTFPSNCLRAQVANAW